MRGFNCITCGESKEVDVNVDSISKDKMTIAVTCRNCLSKLIVHGTYYNTKFTNQNM